MAANPAKIDVAIRLRPLLEQEKMYGLRQSRIKINPASNEVRLLDPEGRNAKSFVFDKVVGGNCSQEEFYDSIEIQRYIDHVLEGYHATVFVYGQTGAGKTYTMEGLEYDLTNNRSSQQRKPNKIIGMKDAGIIPRVIKDLFEKIPVISKKYGRNYNVYCSFLELYNEKIFDLLNPDQVDRISNTSPGLKLRWHKKDQFLVENLYVFACSSPQELEFLFQMGVKNKTMASHRLNNASSRSHCIFEIKIEFSDVNSPDDVVVSKFALVDLAGSERASVVNAEGRMAKEAIEINKSLFTLRQVINAIFESQNRGAKTDYHIPYRESKLTSLLKQSIGGNAYCVMVACLSPIDENFEENLSTLGYASKVTKIQNEPIRNDDPRWAVIQTLKVENVDLLKKLDDANKQILYLTENIPNAKQSGHRQDENGRYPHQEVEGETQMRGPNSQYGGYLDQLESNLKIPYVPGSNPSNLPMEAGTEEFAFSENLTQQLVVAINQIRELLEALKRERERNEGLSLKMEQNDNTIAVLMHENQELRDHINQLESMHPHSHSRTRARSGSTQKNRNPYSKPNAANTSFTHAPFPPSNDSRNKSFTSQDTTTLKNVMPKIGGQPHSQSYTQSYGQSMFQNQGEGKWNQSPLQTAQSNNLKNMQEALQMENHYRTTTMFARNAMYRRGNTTTGRNMSDTQSEFHPSFVDKNNSVLENESRSQISPGRMRQDDPDKFMDENEGYERKGNIVEQRKQMIIPEETKDYYMNQRGSKSGEKGKERTATPLGKIRDNSTGEKRP